MSIDIRKWVTEDTVAAYERDGVVCLRQVIGSHWREKVAGSIEAALAMPGPYDHGYDGGGGRFFAESRRWQMDPDMAAYIFSSPLPALASALLRCPALNLLYDQIFAKEPGTPVRTPWHNDITAWPLTGTQIVSFWLPLDAADAENGRLEFVQGSHLARQLYQARAFSGSKLLYETDESLPPMPDIEADRDAHTILSWDVEPGDLLAFTGHTLHGAGGNMTSTRRRRAYTIRYAGDDVRYAPRPATMPVLDNTELGDGDPLESTLFPSVMRDGMPMNPPAIQTPSGA